MTNRRYDSQFAAITAALDLKVLSATPCARSLLNWLLLICKPGKEIEFELQDFSEFTAGGRSRPYSIRHIWRALKELVDLEVVQIVKEYNWKTWKVVVLHPSVVTSSPPIDRDQLPVDYSAYLQTEHWKSVRNAVFRRDEYACTRCSSKKKLQAHHLTYEHIGQEQNYLADLITLCSVCHSEIHGVAGGES